MVCAMSFVCSRYACEGVCRYNHRSLVYYARHLLVGSYCLSSTCARRRYWCAAAAGRVPVHACAEVRARERRMARVAAASRIVVASRVLDGGGDVGGV